jgi:two-component system chemotaxis response regulator CheY
MVSKKGINILVTDDKPNMRRTIKNMLRRIGYKNIQEADDGDTAMQLLMTHKFDLVICDWNMPRMKGIEVLEKMKSDDTLRSVPFLMVTAEVEESTVAKAAEMGSDSYIIKPFIPETLKKRIGGILEKRENPDAIETKFQSGMTLLSAHQYDEAMTVFQDILKINPHSPRTYYALGQVYEAKNDMNAAQKAYQKAVELSPKFVKVHERLAKIYEKGKDHQSALKHIKVAIKISPWNPHRQVEVGKMHLKMGKPKKAKEAFNKAMQLEPENAERLSEIGEAFLESGYTEDATKAFQPSLHITP